MPREPDGANHLDPGEYVDAARWMQVHQTHYTPEDGDLAVALVTAVADAKGVDPLDADEMPPLYGSFDAEAIDGAFFDRADHSGRSDARTGTDVVTFTHADRAVALRSDGWIVVYAPR